MSSKNQYKDAIKRQKQIISEQKNEIIKLKLSNKALIRKVEYLENKAKFKKWWHFWK